MNVRFDNLSISQFEEKTQAELSVRDKKWMEAHRQDNANDIAPDKFHIFDLPLGIVTGDKCGKELIKRFKNGYKFQRHFTVEVNNPD